MQRFWVTVALSGLTIFSVTSCATNSSDATPGSANSTTTTTSVKPTAPSIKPGQVTGQTLTAACPVLTAGEVKQVLGGGTSTTEITATEGKPDDKEGDKLFRCGYGTGGKEPFVLYLGNILEKGFSATEAVNAFAKQATAKPQQIPRLGEDAAYFSLPGGDVMLAMAKTSHGELRTATFEAPGIVPAEKLAELMTLVDKRL